MGVHMHTCACFGVRRPGEGSVLCLPAALILPGHSRYSLAIGNPGGERGIQMAGAEGVAKWGLGLPMAPGAFPFQARLRGGHYHSQRAGEIQRFPRT